SISAGSASTTATIGSNGTFSAYLTTNGLDASATAYPIVYSYAGDSNFNSASNPQTTLTVTKAHLYVTANANRKAYGQTASDTGAVMGVVNNDGITASFSSPGDAATAPVGTGSYTISATLAPNNKLANYTVHQTDATLTVTKAPLTITADSLHKVY